MAIEGEIAEILNEREVIINRGGEAGVEPGMTFRVTTPDIPGQEQFGGTWWGFERGGSGSDGESQESPDFEDRRRFNSRAPD